MTNLEKYKDELVEVFLNQLKDGTISYCEFLKSKRNNVNTSEFCPNYPTTSSSVDCEKCFRESLRWLSEKALFDWYSLKKGDKLYMKDKTDGTWLDFDVVAVNDGILWVKYKTTEAMKKGWFVTPSVIDNNALLLINQLERDYADFEVRI